MLAEAEVVPVVCLIALLALCYESLQEQFFSLTRPHSIYRFSSSLQLFCTYCNSLLDKLNIDPLLCPSVVLLFYLCHWTEVWHRMRAGPILKLLFGFPILKSTDSFAIKSLANIRWG